MSDVFLPAGDDLAGVRAVVERYVTGVADGDVDAVRRAFRADAHLWGFLGDEPASMPVEAFLDIVAEAPSPTATAADYAGEITAVSVTGGIGMATLVERAYLGMDFVNHFTLLREGGEWRIASKTFVRTAGEPPPPGR